MADRLIYVSGSDLAGNAVQVPVKLADNGDGTFSVSSSTATAGPTDVVVVPIVTSTTAYAAGDVIGGKLTIADAVVGSGHGGLLQSVFVLDLGNQKAPLTILIFNADPTAATLTNDAKIDLTPSSGVDAGKIIRKVNITQGDYETIDNAGSDYAIADIAALAKPIRPVSGVNLYAAIFTTGTPTYGVANGLYLGFGFLRG
jgi:hypothetical protein